ncbi:hypothetical protein HPB47_024502 [Ixodes persulcatus]|uniref:Uncharacterized protein n=1 Tax=Ixodes persulcatus TaxID=34615 RepID=A0AC60Q459_IXOPE|nr:hypothetical protein HPB47_024502 [Ixodes persulcatus]
MQIAPPCCIKEDLMSTAQRDPSLFWAGETATRGKVSDQCLWAACKAMTTGLLLIVIGASMATIGFYSDHLSTVEERRGNITVLVKNENRDKHLDSLTYVGPLVMGMGGFIIVATCVMTFEARDTSSSSAKLVSAWFKRSRSYVAPRPEISCQGTSVSDVSWERFLPGIRHDSTVTEADRSAVTSALINFSKNLQTSFESGRLPPSAAPEGPGGSPREKLQKCQSDPNVVALGSPTFRAPSPLLPRDEVDKEYFLRPPNPQLLRARPFNVSPLDYRKVVSVDCASPPVMESLGESLPAQSQSSQGSMAMDVYFPDGAVTLKVQDKTKGHDSLSSSRKGSKSSTTSSKRLSKDNTGSADSFCSTGSEASRRSRASTPKKSDASKLQSSASVFVSPRHIYGEPSKVTPVLTATKSATLKRYPFTRQKALESHPGHMDA